MTGLFGLLVMMSFSANRREAFIWMPWKLTRDYNRQCLLVQTFCTNSVAPNRTNFFILSKSCWTYDFSHFSFCWHFFYRTCAFCKARSDWLKLPLAALHINHHRVTSKIRLTMPRVKMSRADRNPWLAKMRFRLHFNDLTILW